MNHDGEKIVMAPNSAEGSEIRHDIGNEDLWT